MPGKPPNPHCPNIKALYAGGMRKCDIAKALGIKPAIVYVALQHEPRRITAKGAMQSGAYKLGGWANITDAAINAVARNIRRNETVLDCMARMIVQQPANTTRKETP